MWNLESPRRYVTLVDPADRDTINILLVFLSLGRRCDGALHDQTNRGNNGPQRFDKNTLRVESARVSAEPVAAGANKPKVYDHLRQLYTHGQFGERENDRRAGRSQLGHTTRLLARQNVRAPLAQHSNQKLFPHHYRRRSTTHQLELSPSLSLLLQLFN